MFNTIGLFLGIAQALPAPPISLPGEIRTPNSCVTIGTRARVYDCDEQRPVAMRILFPRIDAFDEFTSGRAQVFIVWCEDYWSGEYQTSYALLSFEPSRADEQLTPDQLARATNQGTFIVERDGHCDGDPVKSNTGTFCDDWDCYPDCCQEITCFVDPSTGVEVRVDVLKDLGTLPCFVLPHNPFLDDASPN